MILEKSLNKRRMNKWAKQTIIGLNILWEKVPNRKMVNNVKHKEPSLTQASNGN
jgi:hypothetical protein